MLNRLNVSTSFLALSLSLAILLPLDVAMGMDPVEPESLETKARTCKFAAHNLATIAFTQKDYGKAFHYANLSLANKGSSSGLMLGEMYEKGLEVAQDASQAYKHYNIATNSSCMPIQQEALFHVARMIYEGAGVEQDYKMAYVQFQRVAEDENSLFQGTAQKYLNKILEDRRDECKPAYKKAKNSFNQQKEKNDAISVIAQFNAIASDDSNPFQEKARIYLDKHFENTHKDFMEALSFYDSRVKTQPDSKKGGILTGHELYDYYFPAYQEFLRFINGHPCQDRARLCIARMWEREQIQGKKKNEQKIALYEQVVEGRDLTACNKALFHLAVDQKPRGCNTTIEDYRSLDAIAKNRNNACAQQACVKATEFIEHNSSLFGDLRQNNKALYESMLYKKYEQLLGFKETSDEYFFKTAEMLYNGSGVCKDVGEAIRRLKKIAANNEKSSFQKKAYFKLANISFDLGIYKDAFEKLVEFSEEFEGPERKEALWKLVKMYDQGLGCTQNYEKSSMILANFGSNDFEAQYKLANRYMTGTRGLPQDIGKAHEILEGILTKNTSHNANCELTENTYKTKANFKLGMLYCKGRQDLSKIHHLYKKYFDEETKMAFQYFTDAAKRGSGKASWQLADMVLKGEVKGDAVNYCKIGAERGNPNACFQLGAMYFHGNELSKDLNLAFSNFSKFFSEKSKEGLVNNRCKKMPDFLKKWILLDQIIQWPDLTKSIKLFEFFLEGKLPDRKKTIQ